MTFFMTSRLRVPTRFASFSPLAILATLVTLLALTGCDLFDSSQDGKSSPADGVSGLTSSWIGTHRDSLTFAQSLGHHDGRLYVTHRHEDEPGTAVVDTATGNIVAYYPHLLQPAGITFTSSGKAVVGEGTWGQPGGISVIDPGSGRIRQTVINFDQDNKVTTVDGRVYLFDRTLGTVTGFTGDVPGENVTLDVQTGAGSNPYGIAVVDGQAYIPRYNLSSLLILGDVDALDGGERDSVDLSPYAHAEGGDIPFMSLVTAHDGYVFVALQRYKADYSEQDSGLVVVIDAATNTVAKTIGLNFKNPSSGFVKEGVWYIAGLGEYMALDGGVEKIDLAAREHAGTVVTEETLGGDVGDVVITGAGAGYVTTSSDFFVTTRVRKISFQQP